MTSTTNTGTALTVGYTYSDDMLTAIQTGSTTYSFSYGDFALRSSTKIGSRTLASYSYSTDGNHYLTSLDYGNGDSVDYSYDKYGNVTKETYEDSETVSYAYDNNGDLATVTDSATGRKNTYYYDTTGRLMKYTEKSDLHEFSMAYSYDELNRVSGVEEDNNGIHRSTVYTYDDSSRVTKSQTENTSRNYTYDGYGRVSQTTTKEGNIQIKSDAYSYSSGSTGTSGQISQHVVDAAGYDKTYNYTYDDNGNIVSISDGSNSITYEYDSANQLIRENNQEGGYTYTWTYNNAGNILNRKEYAYTTGTLGTATDTISYSYDAWGNILTKTGSLANSLGRSNPLCYRGYVYDRETELYYLESRYYNPKIGRF